MEFRLFKIRFTDLNKNIKRATIITDIEEDELERVLNFDVDITSSYPYKGKVVI